MIIDIKALLDWFKYNSKKYPWGENPTPYRVWISEVMLQQTVVSTVIPYFNCWMELFPGACQLAAAEEEQVLRAWEGLGYYSRARNLGKAAKVIVSDYGGKIPRDYKALLKLPGIGPYTACAIMSIAFGEPYPVMDANVLRIVQRLKALPAVDSERQKSLYTELQEIMPRDNPGTFNEAVMQLGQIICRNASPLCLNCPLADHCRAYKKGLQEAIPRRTKKNIVEKKTYVAIIYHGGEIFAYLKSRGLFSGLWLCPGFKKKELSGALKKIFAAAEKIIPLKERTHFYTRYKDHLIPSLYIFKDKPVIPGKKGEWISMARLKALPVPSVYRKILDEVLLLKI